jgi:hypothetical protein
MNFQKENIIRIEEMKTNKEEESLDQDRLNR